MKLGMIGLGRMGANMAQRLMRGGHAIVGFDPQPAARKALEDKGAASAESLKPASMAPRFPACSSTGSRSQPTTRPLKPAWRAASAKDPPISPVPTIVI